ncbi:hypothetical protein ACWGB8_02695 [Kitasatospora sp. NPDC054939]
MTNHAPTTPTPTPTPTPNPASRPSGWSFGYRDFPPCTCDSPDCNGRPEAEIAIVPGHSESGASAGRPGPGAPFAAAVGALVLDSLNDRLGTVMEYIPNSHSVYLRPERGGCEWETDARWLLRPPATANLRAAS